MTTSRGGGSVRAGRGWAVRLAGYMRFRGGTMPRCMLISSLQTLTSLLASLRVVLGVSSNACATSRACRGGAAGGGDIR